MSLCLLIAAVPAGAAAQRSPGCEEVAGTTVAQNERWRVVELADPSSGERLTLACRRGRPATRVRVVHSDADTDDSWVDALSGDRLLLRNADLSSSGGAAAYLFDLARGSAAYVAGSSVDSTGSFVYALTPTGAVARVLWTPAAEALVPVGGQLEVWDSRGRRQKPTVVTELAPKPTRQAAAAGVYYTDANGRPGWVATRGRARASLLKVRRHLRWRTRGDLPRVKSLPGERRTELLTTGSVGGPRIDLLRTGRAGPDQPARIEVRLAGGRSAEVTQPLAPGSAGELRVLASAREAVLIAARFDDRPNERRIRIVERAQSFGRFVVDVPSTPFAELSGSAAATGNTFAVSDGASIQLLSTSQAPIVRPVVGAHDLAWSRVNGPGAIYYTDAAGQVAVSK